MTSRIRIAFPRRGLAVDVDLLDEQAPRVCDFVRASLPQEGLAHHGIYSGSEIAFDIGARYPEPLENMTSRVLPGDVGYWFLPAGQMYGQPDEISEFMWFYDRDAEPRMATGPVQVAIFGRMVGDTAPFFAGCQAMRRQGEDLCRVTLIDAAR